MAHYFENLNVNEAGRLEVEASLEVGDLEIGAVELKNADSDERASIEAADTARTVATKVLAVQNVDASGNVSVPMSVPPYTHSSARDDFIATFTSSTTLTLTGVRFTPSNENLAFIKVTDSSGITSTYINGQNGIAMSISSNVITITGAGTPFASGDSYEVALNSQKKAYDSSLDVEKSIEQAPLWARYTSPESNLSAAQDFTTGWVDLGSEIDMRGYTELLVYATLDINDTINARIKALGKTESGGADEYNFIIETISSSEINMESEFMEWNNDADQLSILKIKSGGVPFIQLQIQAGTVGATAGQIDALKINKIWR